MATRSANRSGSSRSRSSSSTRSNASKNDRSAFRWGTGAIAGAALGGAALAIAANLGRKFLTQSFSASQGNWADSLAAEHDMDDQRQQHIFKRIEVGQQVMELINEAQRIAAQGGAAVIVERRCLAPGNADRAFEAALEQANRLQERRFA